MNKLDAYKMDGLGNDFIIFDKRKKSIFSGLCRKASFSTRFFRIYRLSSVRNRVRGESSASNESGRAVAKSVC